MPFAVLLKASHQPYSIIDSQFLICMKQMQLYRSLGDPQFPRNLLIARTRSDPLDDLPLAWRKSLRITPNRASRTFACRSMPRDMRVWCQNLAYAGDED